MAAFSSYTLQCPSVSGACNYSRGVKRGHKTLLFYLGRKITDTKNKNVDKMERDHILLPT